MFSGEHRRSFEVAFTKRWLDSSRCMHVTVLVIGDEAAAVGPWVRNFHVRQQLGIILFYFQCILTKPQNISPHFKAVDT